VYDKCVLYCTVLESYATGHFGNILYNKMMSWLHKMVASSQPFEKK